MHNSRETIILNLICVGLVALAGIFHLISDTFVYFSENILIYYFYLAALFIWTGHMRKRVLQQEERKYLTLMILLLIFLMFLRTVKFIFLAEDSLLNRYVWYLYYLPMVFTVLYVFLTTLHIGKPYDYALNPKWKLLYIPAALIVIGILTNDIHQTAFYFPEGIENWRSDSSYSHGVLYFIALGWIAVLFTASMATAFIKCAVNSSKRNIWMPVIPLAVGGIYCAAFLINPDGILPSMYKVAEVMCFIVPAFIESLILARFIPSNDNYDALWKVSSIGGGIIDAGNRICYVSENSMAVSPAQIREAADYPVAVKNDSVILRSSKVHGGYGYWLKDISEIKKLDMMLEEAGNILEEKNRMLEEENKIIEKRIKIAEKNRLYKDIAVDTKPQLLKLNEILSAPEADEARFEQQMKYASILNAYIKRRSYLLLVSNENKHIHSDELCLAVSETLEYIRFYGVTAYGNFTGSVSVKNEVMLLLYRIFEEIVESSIPGAEAMLVNIRFGEKLQFNIEIDHPGEYISEDFMREEIAEHDGMLHVSNEDGIEFVSLEFPGGDEL